MIQESTSIISTAAVVVSLVFAGIQARALVKQLSTGNTIAGTSELRAVVQNVHTVMNHLVRDPELWEFFYSNKTAGPTDPRREKVLLLAEMYADALELGLFTTKRIPETESWDDWIDYADFLIRNSPALRAVIEEHSTWWPELFQQSTIKHY